MSFNLYEILNLLFKLIITNRKIFNICTFWVIKIFHIQKNFLSIDIKLDVTMVFEKTSKNNGLGSLNFILILAIVLLVVQVVVILWIQPIKCVSLVFYWLFGNK